MAVSRPSHNVASPIEATLREIRDEQTRQAGILADMLRALERGRGARDAADVTLLVAVAEAIGDRTFTSAQLMTHADVDPGLREALLAADVTCGQELGCVFRRLEGITVSGVRLARVGTTRAGIAWRVQVCEA